MSKIYEKINNLPRTNSLWGFLNGEEGIYVFNFKGGKKIELAVFDFYNRNEGKIIKTVYCINSTGEGFENFSFQSVKDVTRYITLENLIAGLIPAHVSSELRNWAQNVIYLVNVHRKAKIPCPLDALLFFENLSRYQITASDGSIIIISVTKRVISEKQITTRVVEVEYADGRFKDFDRPDWYVTLAGLTRRSPQPGVPGEIEAWAQSLIDFLWRTREEFVKGNQNGLTIDKIY
jgi:hypothetical protein